MVLYEHSLVTIKNLIWKLNTEFSCNREILEEQTQDPPRSVECTGLYLFSLQIMLTYRVQMCIPLFARGQCPIYKCFISTFSFKNTLR